MATRSRWRRRRGRRSGVVGRGSGAEEKELASTEPESKGEAVDTPASTPAQQLTPTQDAPAIRKGVYLSALIYVEGEMPAPEDFAAQATSTLKEALGEAFKTKPGGLSMKVKRVEVRNDVEENNDDAGEEGKFQF